MRSGILVALTGLLALSGCTGVVPLDEIMLEPSPEITTTPADLGADYEEVSVPVAEGRSITAWYVPAPQPKALLVVLPGAAMNKSLYATIAVPLVADTDYDLLLMDYEGFGNSPGTATLRNTVDDALAITRYALTRHRNVGLIGISLGAPLAARAAADYDVFAIAMEGTVIIEDAMNQWASHIGWAGRVLRAVGPRILDDHFPRDFDVLTYISRARGAKLVIHSTEDTLTPFYSALKVYHAASPPKYFWPEYWDHGQMARLEPNLYGRTLMDWFDMVLAQRHQASAQ